MRDEAPGKSKVTEDPEATKDDKIVALDSKTRRREEAEVQLEAAMEALERVVEEAARREFEEALRRAEERERSGFQQMAAERRIKAIDNMEAERLEPELRQESEIRQEADIQQTKVETTE